MGEGKRREGVSGKPQLHRKSQTEQTGRTDTTLAVLSVAHLPMQRRGRHEPSQPIT